MKHKKYKKEYDYSYTLGIYPTVELLQNKPHIVECVYLHSTYTSAADIPTLCQKHNIELTYSDSAIERLSPKENAYAVAIFRKYAQSLTIGNNICLDGISDMGNLGTIIRTAAGFGIHNIAIIDPAADSFNPKVIRASMGASFLLNIQHFPTFAEYHALHPNTVYPFMLNASHTLNQITTIPTPYTLVFGNESSGLSDTYRQYSSTVTIPHNNKIDSLNLPIAAAIAMYHFTNSPLTNEI